ncbi:MAG: DUF5661 family protein [Ferruginibacter sp.]
MKSNSGGYQDVYIKRDDKMLSLKQDVTDFCAKYLKKLQIKQWDWSERDFEDPDNDPTIAEARAIRDVVFRDMDKNIATEVDLSTMNNVKCVRAFLNPKSKHEEFNMNEFAYALKVELEHGRVKDVNVTNNHPYLTAMIVFAHMTESLTYYKRLKVMETEAEIFELLRKIAATGIGKNKYYKMLADAEHELTEARKALSERLDKMDDIPVLEKIGD